MSAENNEMKTTKNAGNGSEKNSQTQNNSSESLKSSNEKQKNLDPIASEDNSKSGNRQSSEDWIKCGDFSLTLFDKHALESPKGWLTDTIINAAQHLLKRQFPKVKGLQNVLLNALQEFKPIKGTDTFVQILNESEVHWLVISNARVDKKANKCIIYDSRAKTQMNYSEDVSNAILKLMNPADPINVEVHYVTQQLDSHQCGLYAVAFAYLLCAGKNPSEILLSCSGPLIRKHLMTCLSKGEITEFPTGRQTIVDLYII